MIFFAVGLLGSSESARAQDTESAEAAKDPYRSTSFPLPRFASVGGGKAFVRKGPGEKYPVAWVIERRGLPVEITLEYDNWRRIRDIEGHEGWMHHTLLSGRRTGIVGGDSNIEVYRAAPDNSGKKSSLVAYLEPSVQVEIRACKGDWCRISAQGFTGWIERKFIWGVYADENFD